MVKFRLIVAVLTALSITVKGQFGVDTGSKKTSSKSKSAASQPGGNFAIPTALRRPNPFLQRLPSAAADQEALFQSKASQTQSQTGANPTNQPSYQNGQQPGGNQAMFNNQPDPYQTGSYQGPYNSMNSNNNNPPTMAGPVPADRISYQPAPTNTVQSGYQQPVPGQQSMQVPNTGPSYDIQNQYPPQQNAYSQPEPQYSNQYQSQYPQYNQPQPGMQPPMTLNSPAGPVQTPGFNDPNGKGYDAYGQPSYPPYEQQPQTQPGAYQQPQTQPGAYQQPQTQSGAYQQPQTQQGAYQQPQSQLGAYQEPQTQPGAYQQPQSQPGAYQQPQSQPGAYQQPQTQPVAYQQPQTQPGAYQQPPAQPGAYQQPQTGGYQPTYVDPNQQYQTQQQGQSQYSQYQQPANPAPPTQTYADPNVPIPRVPGQQQPYDPQAQGQGVPATAPAPASWNQQPVDTPAYVSYEYVQPQQNSAPAYQAQPSAGSPAYQAPPSVGSPAYQGQQSAGSPVYQAQPSAGSPAYAAPQGAAPYDYANQPVVPQQNFQQPGAYQSAPPVVYDPQPISGGAPVQTVYVQQQSPYPSNPAAPAQYQYSQPGQPQAGPAYATYSQAGAPYHQHANGAHVHSHYPGQYHAHPPPTAPPTTTPAPTTTTAAAPAGEVEIEGPVTTPAPITTTTAAPNLTAPFVPYGQPPVPAQYSGYPPQNAQGYPPQTQYYDPSQPQQPYYGAQGQPQQVQYVQQPSAYQPQQPGAYPGQPQQGAAYPQQQPAYQQQYQAQPPAQPGYPPQQQPQQQAYQQPGYPPQTGYPPQQPQTNGYAPQQPGYQQQPQQGPYQFSSPAAKFPANNPYNQQQSVQYPQSGQSYTPPRTQQPQNQAPMSGKIQELLTKIRQAQSHSTSPTKTVEEKNKWNAIFRKLWDIYLFWSNMKQSNKQTNQRGMVTA